MKYLSVRAIYSNKQFKTSHFLGFHTVVWELRRSSLTNQGFFFLFFVSLGGNIHQIKNENINAIVKVIETVATNVLSFDQFCHFFDRKNYDFKYRHMGA